MPTGSGEERHRPGIPAHRQGRGTRPRRRPVSRHLGLRRHHLTQRHRHLRADDPHIPLQVPQRHRLGPGLPDARRDPRGGLSGVRPLRGRFHHPAEVTQPPLRHLGQVEPARARAISSVNGRRVRWVIGPPCGSATMNPRSSPDETYRRVLRGIDEGDPAVLDAIEPPAIGPGAGYTRTTSASTPATPSCPAPRRPTRTPSPAASGRKPSGPPASTPARTRPGPQGN
jgi:hypothetical protein